MERAGLRNEDYVAFLDESGQDGLQVVSGVLIPARWLRSAERRWKDFVSDHLRSPSGRLEVKSRELLRGEGVAYQAQQALLESGHPAISARAAGRQFYRDALQHIASINEVRVLSVGLPTNYPVEVYRLWFWMAYAILVERRNMPRPRLPLAVIDGEDASFRSSQDLVAYRFFKQFPRVQPYVGGGNKWFVGGSVLQDSALHPFIQMADLLAGSARYSIAQNKRYGKWYGKHLKDHGKKLGRQVDVSSRALAQLKRRSREDACGSGWHDAQLA